MRRLAIFLADFSLYTLVLEVGSAQIGTEHAQCCQGALIILLRQWWVGITISSEAERAF